jgi:hypothetical protein
MTMPSSGPISLGQANTELGRSATATLTMNDSALRTLAGVGGSGTTWGMNSLYGKSARTFSLASLTSISGTAFEGGFAYAEYVFYADGTTGYFSSEGSGSFGNWTTPTTSGIGSSYWIKFTETGSAGAATETGSGRGIWNQLNVAQYYIRLIKEAQQNLDRQIESVDTTILNTSINDELPNTRINTPILFSKFLKG